MLNGAIKFIIKVDQYGEVEVHNGSDQEISGTNTGNLADTAIDLGAANKLIHFDSLAIMGYGPEASVTQVCVKRLNCTWYCS